ncbi:glycosyltransferase family 39 protein [Hydrogenophaga sp.]|uniref:ArnT family glycosyltransferase n=1 Tax=Hydrogenophaga sp. TaxID=1904254 RepID=UPI0025BC507D|nr:glycosyltransferase family 39 protein [Hydrogenophaga sp.]
MKPPDFSIAASRRLFWLIFAGTLLLKIVIAAGFPITGDEAFFYQWGVRPAWGYSDHPPMVGWLLAVLHGISDQPIILRSVTVLVTSVIALGLVDALMRILPAEREASAWMAGAVYLALPWSWMFVLVTTDTLLLLFMAVSAWCYVRANACPDRGAGWYTLAGGFVGLAFLSKYFAVLLGMAYAVHILGWRRDRWWAPLLMFAAALPAIAVNVAFNATHGWTNVMFNVFNRNEGGHWNLQTPLTYVAMVGYLFTPWLLWQAGRAPRADGVAPATRRALAVLWLFPILLFAVISLRRTIGLHWVLGFVPLFVAWAALFLDARSLRRSLNGTLLLSAPHLLIVAAVAWAPLSWWQPTRLHDRAVFLRETPVLVEALQRDMPAGATLMARTYNPAAMLAFHHQQYVPVFGVGRHHARQDDQQVNFRDFDGQSLRIFDYNPPDLADFAPYFERVSSQVIEIEGVRFYAVDGTGFRFQPYRDTVLTTIAREFHQVPTWLPLLGSPFCERYGFAECSPGR